MHSRASRAMDGIKSVKRACEEPNARFMSEDKNEPNASAARSGTVIMILPNAFLAIPIGSHTPRCLATLAIFLGIPQIAPELALIFAFFWPCYKTDAPVGSGTV